MDEVFHIATCTFNSRDSKNEQEVAVVTFTFEETLLCLELCCFHHAFAASVFSG